jgi:hypothetical protein
MFGRDRTARHLLTASALVLGLGSTPALAQDQAPGAPAGQTGVTDQASQGPLTVERIPSGWVVSPDVTFTALNKDFGTLVGAYAGWLAERTWLVGAGGYWLANRQDDFKLAYGGLVLQYMARSDQRIGFGVKGLVGGGEATVGASYEDVYGTPPVYPAPAVRFGSRHVWGDGHRPLPPSFNPATRLVYDEVIFVAEPQAQLLWNVTSTVRLTVGAGYRFTAGGREVNDRIMGPVGSIGVEFGGGK